MNICDYYRYPHTLEECAKKYGLTVRTAMDKIREENGEIDLPVTDNLYSTYLQKIACIRSLFSYPASDADMEALKRKDYETWFSISWVKETRRLTKMLS